MRQLNPKLLGEGYHFIPCKHSTLISGNSFRGSKPIYDLVLDEFDHFILRHNNYRLILHPFGEVIYGKYDEAISLGARWVDFSNKIHSPSFEWPWLGYWV